MSLSTRIQTTGPRTKHAGRWAGSAVAVGFLLTLVIAEMTQLNAAFQQALQQPLVAMCIVLVVLGSTIIPLLLWARLSTAPDRVVYVTSVLVGAWLAICFQALAPAVGWWAGTAFKAPLFVQAVVFGMKLAAGVALFLALYRWLSARRPWLALLVYAFMTLLFVPATLIEDQQALSTGMYVFRGGYTPWTDALYFVAILWVPLLVYTVLMHRLKVTERERPTSSRA